ncbi:unnamed protein product [Discosporangium mesarthrocarpum]
MVKETMEAALATVQKEIQHQLWAHLRGPAIKGSEGIAGPASGDIGAVETWSIKVCLPDSRKVVVEMPSKGKGGTLGDIRTRIHQLSGIPLPLLVLYVSGPPEQLIRGHDKMPLVDCPGLLNRSTVSAKMRGAHAGGGEAGDGGHPEMSEGTRARADAHGGQNSKVTSVLNKATHAGVVPPTPVHAVALALHCLLVDAHFIPTAKEKGAGEVKGFAPPIRDVPEDKLVPSDWDMENSAVCFQYRRPDQSSATYVMRVMGIGPDKALVSLAERGGPPFSLEVSTTLLPPGGTLDAQGGDDFFKDLFALFRRDILHPALPHLAQAHAEDPPPQGHHPERDTGSGEAGGGRSDALPSPANVPIPIPDPYPSPYDENPLRVGQPSFPGPVPPDMDPSLFVPGRGGDFGGDIFPTRGGLPGPGGLMGPAHPMFGAGPGPRQPFQPRFDPYSPPTPGQPLGPGGPGVPGVPGGAGRGRGRGGEDDGRSQPGRPDHDHLKPPGNSPPGNMFF